MDFPDACKKRQAELLRILETMNDDPFWDSDDATAQRLKRRMRETISQYEKILHLLAGDQIGHA